MAVVDWGEYWWSSVTGPREIVALTISVLRSKKSAILYVPLDLPWRHEMRRCVRNNLESVPGLEELIVDVVDIEDEDATGIDPGEFLLDKYALRDDKTRFRKGGKESIQDYLLRKNVLRNKLVWVKGLETDCAQKWVSFCEHWESKNIADGVLVIEAREQPSITRKSHVELVRYQGCVSEYDVLLFNSLVIGGDDLNRLDASWKKYAAAITTHLCGTDAEIARSFVEQHDFKEDNPIETIEDIVDSGFFNRRGSGRHVLALYRNGDISELLKRIWAAQVEILFPLIEQQRLEVIDTYRPQFEAAIEEGLSQFDVIVEKPEDIELGTMVYLMASKRLDIPEYETKNRIHVLRDCRNRLAHREVCTLDNVSALLDH